MQLKFQFSNPAQREFYYATARKQIFSGAFNSGKTYIACLKAVSLLLTFPKYRLAIGRQTYSDLRKTTMETFWKVLPKEMVQSHNDQQGTTTLINGSTIIWLHLDKIDESTLRGLEINSFLGDQAEEFEEKVYDVLLARVGRWDEAIVPPELLAKFPNWPTNKLTGKYIAPSYLMMLCNPDTEFHFIYRKFHPESPDRELDAFWVDAVWDDKLGSIEALDEAKKKDPEFVNKYVLGKWGSSDASIHIVPRACILEPDEKLLAKIRAEGNLTRVLDHGDSAPTCCLWVAAIGGVYIFYREYYVPGKVISYHRQSIYDLSENEEYTANYADPQIFKKTAQKDGGFWSVADEYGTSDTDAPELTWLPADNNEFATRNRINELLQLRYVHPVSQERNSPGLYFIKATTEYPYGCKESFKQLGAQRKKVLGTLNGKTIYADDRDDTVDHAYDCVRYYVAMHGSQPNRNRRIPRHSFAYYTKVLEMQKHQGMVAGSV